MADPTIVRLEPDDDLDTWWLEETLDREARRLKSHLPTHYSEAVVTDPAVREWIRELIAGAVTANRERPSLRRGPSLLLVGGTGVGKTYQAYGSIRALAVSGVSCSWLVTTAADMYARLRPRPGIDSETEFGNYANARFLVLDDLGAAKGSEWTEEINYRLVNHRYEHELPTLITSNVTPKDLGSALGERVASRLSEMATRVVLKGADRRIAVNRVVA